LEWRRRRREEEEEEDFLNGLSIRRFAMKTHGENSPLFCNVLDAYTHTYLRMNQNRHAHAHREFIKDNLCNII
jgi:hypothetical protein